MLTRGRPALLAAEPAKLVLTVEQNDVVVIVEVQLRDGLRTVAFAVTGGSEENAVHVSDS
jgi:hypothetical protein